MFPDIFSGISKTSKRGDDLSFIVLEQLEVDRRFQQDLYYLCGENSVDQAHAEYWSMSHYYASLINLKQKIKRLEKRNRKK